MCIAVLPSVRVPETPGCSLLLVMLGSWCSTCLYLTHTRHTTGTLYCNIEGWCSPGKGGYGVCYASHLGFHGGFQTRSKILYPTSTQLGHLLCACVRVCVHVHVWERGKKNGKTTRCSQVRPGSTVKNTYSDTIGDNNDCVIMNVMWQEHMSRSCDKNISTS